MKTERSVDHRNFVGGCIGGVLGIFAMSAFGTLAMVIATLVGFFVGFCYDRIARLFREFQDARKAWSATSPWSIDDNVLAANTLTFLVCFAGGIALMLGTNRFITTSIQTSVTHSVIQILLAMGFFGWIMTLALMLRVIPNNIPDWCQRARKPLVHTENSFHWGEMWAHRNKIQRRRAMQRKGFLGYVCSRCWNMYKVWVIQSLVITPVLCVSVAAGMIHALVRLIPLGIVWGFFKSLPFLGRGQHWLGMLTTLVTTSISAYLFQDRLSGPVLVLAAFGNGLICGLAAMTMCRAVAWFSQTQGEQINKRLETMVDSTKTPDVVFDACFKLGTETKWSPARLLGSKDRNYELL